MTDNNETIDTQHMLQTGALEGWVPFDAIRYDIEMSTLRAMFVMLCQVFNPAKTTMDQISSELKQYGEIYVREEKMPQALADVMRLKLHLARGGLTYLAATDMNSDERLRMVFARNLKVVAEAHEIN